MFGITWFAAGITTLMRIAVLATILFLIFYFGGDVYHYVKDHGLRTAVERVWEGPQG